MPLVSALRAASTCPRCGNALTPDDCIKAANRMAKRLHRIIDGPAVFHIIFGNEIKYKAQKINVDTRSRKTTEPAVVYTEEDRGS